MTARDSGYRGDIDGLRAIAVSLVVLYHMGADRVFLRFGWRLFEGGFVGVDVFYVLSGFLITGLLMREIRATGRLDVALFYTRRIRRLLPLSSLVLASTVLASFILLPTMDWPDVSQDGFAAASYFANMRFASQATHYLTGGPSHSPLLHYWSLSVEEQFYLVWPGLFALMAAPATLWGALSRWRHALVVGGLVVVSATASVLLTESSPWAFFGLHTRAWELGVGAMVALLQLEGLRLGRWSSLIAGWLGLATICASALLITRDTSFPGVTAWLPVAGTALVVAAGISPSRGGVGALLSLAPLRYLGNLSYAWYLWHWPFIVLSGPAVGSMDRPVASIVVTAVVLSFVASVVSHHALENPMRRWEELGRGWRPAVLALGTVGGMGAVALVTSLFGPKGAGPSDPAFAHKDSVHEADGCMQEIGGVTPAACEFGVASGTQTLALLGDSHATAWMPAFDGVARTLGWRGVLYAKASCPPLNVTSYLRDYRRTYFECEAWRGSVLARLAELQPEVVVLARYGVYADALVEVGGELATPERAVALWQAGAADTFDALRSVTRRIVVMRDVPKPQTNIIKCLARNGGASCDFDATKGVHWDEAMFSAEAAAAVGRVDVSFVDLSRVICDADPCPARTSDGAIKYRDDNHLTATYSASLAPVLGERLGLAAPKPEP